MIRPAGARALGNLADADLGSWRSSALRVATRYVHEFPLHPGDPSDTSRMSGAWLMDARVAVDPGR
jgi:hypothetical protein